MAEKEVQTEKQKATETEDPTPNWIKLKPTEVESLIVELAQKGESPASIGLTLRDKHGIPKVKSVLGKKIEKILKEKNITYNSEKELTEKSLENLKKHIGTNKHDFSASRALTKKLWALQKYS